MRYHVRTLASPIGEKALNRLWWNYKWHLISVVIVPAETTDDGLVQYVHYFSTHFLDKPDPGKID